MHCFSVKRLSPFQGTLQIIDGNEARAFTRNGMHWQIQIKHHLINPKWGNLESIVFAQKYLRYGFWDKQDGLSRLPVPPTVDIDRVNILGQEIVNTIQEKEASLPFPSRDTG